MIQGVLTGNSIENPIIAQGGIIIIKILEDFLVFHEIYFKELGRFLLLTYWIELTNWIKCSLRM